MHSSPCLVPPPVPLIFLQHTGSDATTDVDNASLAAVAVSLVILPVTLRLHHWLHHWLLHHVSLLEIGLWEQLILECRLLEGRLLVGLGLVSVALLFILLQSWALGEPCGLPCKVSGDGVGLGVLVELTANVQQRDDIVHSSVGAAHPILPCCIWIVLCKRRLASMTSVAFVDVATTDAVVVGVLKDVVEAHLYCFAGTLSSICVWLLGVRMLLHLTIFDPRPVAAGCR